MHDGLRKLDTLLRLYIMMVLPAATYSLQLIPESNKSQAAGNILEMDALKVTLGCFTERESGRLKEIDGFIPLKQQKGCTLQACTKG